jgi:superoxide dismutase
MDFGAKAAGYVDCFMGVIRWKNVEDHFKAR